MRLWLRLGWLGLLLTIPPLASAQTAGLQETYVREAFLRRDYGQGKNVKLDRASVASYKGNCNRVVQVREVQFAKGTVTFALVLLGEVAPNDDRSWTMCTEEETQVEQLIISGFRGDESQLQLESVINQVLLTPEAYLKSYGLSVPPTLENPTAPLSNQSGVSYKPILRINPVYPIAILKTRMTVSVNVSFIIGRDGRVYELKVTKGEGTPLADAFRKVMGLQRYSPPMLGGQSVATRTGTGTTYVMHGH